MRLGTHTLANHVLPAMGLGLLADPVPDPEGELVGIGCTLTGFTVFCLDAIHGFNVQAVKHVQSNPDEVCPAGWHPGDKTMKPTPKVSQNSAGSGWELP
jgi:hypothetical protein